MRKALQAVLRATGLIAFIASWFVLAWLLQPSQPSREPTLPDTIPVDAHQLRLNLFHHCHPVNFTLASVYFEEDFGFTELEISGRDQRTDQASWIIQLPGKLSPLPDSRASRRNNLGWRYLLRFPRAVEEDPILLPDGSGPVQQTGRRMGPLRSPNAFAVVRAYEQCGQSARHRPSRRVHPGLSPGERGSVLTASLAWSLLEYARVSSRVFFSR